MGYTPVSSANFGFREEWPKNTGLGGKHETTAVLCCLGIEGSDHVDMFSVSY